MICKNHTDNFSITCVYGNVLAEEYYMKSIGKNDFKVMIINNEKFITEENNFTWIDSLTNYGKGFSLVIF